MMSVIIILAAAYIIGSFPTGIVLGKILKGIDIREHGSGSSGATNVSRILGWKIGILVLLLDALKGAISVMLPVIFLGNFNNLVLLKVLAGLLSVVGHIWTIFAKFKGGKGIATSLGFLLALLPIDTLMVFLLFLIIVSITRYVSLGSISAAIALPISLIIRTFILKSFSYDEFVIVVPFCVLLSMLVIFTHRTNITRLLNGKENKFSFKKGSK